MNEQIWWHLARSSGIVAVVLLVLGAVLGVLLATRVLTPHDRPAWLLDLHRWIGGLAVTTTGLHLAGLALDTHVEFGLPELFLPGASPYRPQAVAIGVITMYLLVAVQLTSLLRRRLPRQLWRVVHLTSYVTVWGGLLHAGLAGTDVVNRVYQAIALAMTLLAASAAIVRIVAPRRRRPPGTTPTGSPDHLGPLLVDSDRV